MVNYNVGIIQFSEELPINVKREFVVTSSPLLYVLEGLYYVGSYEESGFRWFIDKNGGCVGFRLSTTSFSFV